MSSAQDLLSQLQTLVPQNGQAPSEAHIKQAQDVLRKLKLELVKQQPGSGSDVQSFLLMQRTTLELAAFLSLYARDVPAFVRYIAQLKTSYNDMRALLPPSKAQAPLLGAYLLCLLSQNQIADFHTEYDLLAYSATSTPSSAGANSAHLPPSSPTSARSVSRSELLSSSYIAFPVALEQQLMEGCYSQILAANADSSKLPSPVYALFLDTLAATVRGKIADCSEQAYASLSLKDLASMLRLSSTAEAEKFVAARDGWSLQKSADEKGEATVHFLHKQMHGADNSKEINAHKTIQQTLAYATELERIV